MVATQSASLRATSSSLRTTTLSSEACAFVQAMEVAAQAPHAVVLSCAEQGHINPLIQFSRKLASSGCFVTFVVSRNNAPSDSSHPNLHFEGVPDNLPPERSRGSTFRDSMDSMINMEVGVRDLLHRLQRLKLRPVSFVVADFFVTWSVAVASHFCIPCILFFTSNATACATCLAFPSLVAQGIMPFSRDDKGTLTATEPVDFFPGLPPLLPVEFPEYMTFDGSLFEFRIFLDVSENFRSASAVILNTFEELDGKALAEIRKGRRTYAVCPLLPPSGAPPRLDVNCWAEDDACLRWLGMQKPTSVLYVSFGSLASLPAVHLRELAWGIEASGQPFLWVIRSNSVDSSLDDSLPEDFLHRTKDRGLIISWAPQIRVLSHPSVGGFLTHGGWNSIVENLSTGGVPMMCWPVAGEQRLNRKLVVEEWKIGMGFRHKEDGMVEKAEVEKVVRCMMQEQRGEDIRKTVQKVRDAAKKAIEDGGSSRRDFESLLEFLGIPPK